jgi:hypothetical protein
MKFEVLSVAQQRARMFYCRHRASLARKGHAASLTRPRLLLRPNTRPERPKPRKANDSPRPNDEAHRDGGDSFRCHGTKERAVKCLSAA